MTTSDFHFLKIVFFVTISLFTSFDAMSTERPNYTINRDINFQVTDFSIESDGISILNNRKNIDFSTNYTSEVKQYRLSPKESKIVTDSFLKAMPNIKMLYLLDEQLIDLLISFRYQHRETTTSDNYGKLIVAIQRAREDLKLKFHFQWTYNNEFLNINNDNNRLAINAGNDIYFHVNRLNQLKSVTDHLSLLVHEYSHLITHNDNIAEIDKDMAFFVKWVESNTQVFKMPHGRELIFIQSKQKTPQRLASSYTVTDDRLLGYARFKSQGNYERISYQAGDHMSKFRPAFEGIARSSVLAIEKTESDVIVFQNFYKQLKDDNKYVDSSKFGLNYIELSMIDIQNIKLKTTQSVSVEYQLVQNNYFLENSQYVEKSIKALNLSANNLSENLPRYHNLEISSSLKKISHQTNYRNKESYLINRLQLQDLNEEKVKLIVHDFQSIGSYKDSQYHLVGKNSKYKQLVSLLAKSVVLNEKNLTLVFDKKNIIDFEVSYLLISQINNQTGLYEENIIRPNEKYKSEQKRIFSKNKVNVSHLSAEKDTAENKYFFNLKYNSNKKVSAVTIELQQSVDTYGTLRHKTMHAGGIGNIHNNNETITSHIYAQKYFLSSDEFSSFSNDQLQFSIKAKFVLSQTDPQTIVRKYSRFFQVKQTHYMTMQKGTDISHISQLWVHFEDGTFEKIPRKIFANTTFKAIMSCKDLFSNSAPLISFSEANKINATRF